MNNFRDNRIFESTEIKSKKKSIKRHNRLVRKEITLKKLKRRHPGDRKSHLVFNNNFLYMLKRELGDDVVQLESFSPIVHELKVEFAMEKPTDAIEYMIPQYVSGGAMKESEPW